MKVRELRRMIEVFEEIHRTATNEDAAKILRKLALLLSDHDAKTVDALVSKMKRISKA